MDYHSLGHEVVEDPAGLGYTGKTDSQVAAILMAVNQQVACTKISAAELWENTNLAEYAGLTAARLQAYNVLISLGTIDVSGGTNSREALKDLFPAGGPTRTKLVALISKPLLKSRAEILGLGLVWPGHVGKARAQFGG